MRILTEQEYDTLIKLFKEKLSYTSISRIMEIPVKTVSREHSRWKLYKAIYTISHPDGELEIPINKGLFITDKGYEYLIGQFKKKVPKKKISRSMGVPLKQIEEEHERWQLCNAIYECSHPAQTENVWNGGKRFDLAS